MGGTDSRACNFHIHNGTVLHIEQGTGYGYDDDDDHVGNRNYRTFDLNEHGKLDIHIFLVVFLAVVIVLGVLGNVLILVIVWVEKKHRTVSSYYVACLAFTDVVVLLTCGMLNLAFLVGSAFGLPFRDFPWAVYDCFTFIHLASKGVTCCMLVSLTIDRYLAIVRPLSALWFRTAKNALIVSGAVWIGSIIYATVIYGCEYFVDALVVYILVCLTEYVAPLAFNVFLYVIIIRAIWLPAQRIYSVRGRGGNDNNNGDDHRKQKFSVLRMVLVALIVFSVSVGFHHVVSLYILITTESPEKRPCHVTLLALLANIALFLNSALNPFVYGFTNSTFSEPLKRALCCCRITGPECLLGLRKIPDIYRRLSGASTTVFVPSAVSHDLSSDQDQAGQNDALNSEEDVV